MEPCQHGPPTPAPPTQPPPLVPLVLPSSGDRFSAVISCGVFTGSTRVSAPEGTARGIFCRTTFWTCLVAVWLGIVSSLTDWTGIDGKPLQGVPTTPSPALCPCFPTSRTPPVSLRVRRLWGHTFSPAGTDSQAKGTRQVSSAIVNFTNTKNCLIWPTYSFFSWWKLLAICGS